MPRISLKYGHEPLEVKLPEGLPYLTIEPAPTVGVKNIGEQDIIRQALKEPVASLPLKDLARGKRNGVVVISDPTRLVPSHQLLPALLQQLHDGGLQNDGITVLVEVGNHRPVSRQEKELLVGREVAETYQVRHAKEKDYVRLGLTTRGTPVEVSGFLAEAELKIFTGNIEMHRLAGFSGGVKACIGISSPIAIEHNHKLSRLGPFPPGQLDGNIVRADLEEYARIVGVDFLLNVITDETGRIEAAWAGDVVAAHKAGTAYAIRKYHRPLEKPADVVIVSAGGSPKDGSLYQAVKTLQNSCEVLAEGGTIVLAAACQEGFGDKVFMDWALAGGSSSEILNRGQREFILGGHKAVALAQVLNKVWVHLVSDMEDREVLQLGFKPFPSLQEAVDNALKRYTQPRVLVIPYGGVTFPYLDKKN